MPFRRNFPIVQKVDSPLIQEVLATAKEEADNVNCFTMFIRKHTEIAELAPKIVREFIDTIAICEKQKAYGKRTQEVEIFYNCVGAIHDFAQEKTA